MIAQRRLRDGRILTVYAELLGTACIAIDDNPYVRGDTAWDRHLGTVGEHRESDGGYDRYFQFMSIEQALDAFNAMTVDDDEPAGWHRAAPPRFRRRPGGDPAKEYVAP